jgi:cyclic beta-1,2-glucan synthetase
MDWREFVETLSAVERALRSDPADVYNNMDFATRDRYRHVVEEIAKRSSLSEDEIAQRAIHFARERIVHSSGDDRATHVGFYLIDKGRSLLEHAVGLRPSAKTILKRIGPSLPAGALWRAILALTAILTAAVLLTASWVRPWHAWGLLFLGIPLLLCASHLSVSVTNWLATLLVPPRTLPRMEFSNGIPPDLRTMVVVPTMLTSAAGVRDLLDSLELQFLANRDAHLHFALLTDFCDASQETHADDGTRGPGGGRHRSPESEVSAERDDAFFLFHRPRRWNEQEGVWMGWERKRGKLAEFNALLRGRRERPIQRRRRPDGDPPQHQIRHYT